MTDAAVIFFYPMSTWFGRQRRLSYLQQTLCLLGETAMQNARCPHTNTTYSAHNFGQQMQGGWQQSRPNLVCPECGGPAFFRGQTENGRDACFGARPHANDCTLRAAQSTAKGSDSASNGGTVNGEHQRLVVDFAYGAQQTCNEHGLGGGLSDVEAVSEEQMAAVGRARHTRTLRLRSLLRMLMTDPTLAYSTQQVTLNGFGTYRFDEAFARFDDINPWHEGRTMGLFGHISSTYWSNQSSSLWLNTGGFNDLSICVAGFLLHFLMERFGIAQAAGFVQSEVLVFGRLRTSSNGKMTVLLEDLSLITVKTT